MDADTDTELLIGDGSTASKVKEPKKPKAKKIVKAKPKAKKVPTKRKLAKKSKAKKKVVKAKKAAKKLPKRKVKKPARPVVRTERLDMRLSKAEKAKVGRIAKRLKRTLTSVVYEAIEKLK